MGTHPKTDSILIAQGIPLKQWRHEEADRKGVKPGTVASWMRRGKCPDLKLRRVNARVVYVVN